MTRAPYLAALVANSCNRSARLVTAAPEIRASISESAMRWPFGSSNGLTMVRTSDGSVVGWCAASSTPRENVSE